MQFLLAAAWYLAEAIWSDQKTVQHWVGGVKMADIPCALVKELRATGYFFEELKSCSDSKEIDLASLSKDLAVPYLARKSASYQSAERIRRGMILDLAVKFLSEASDGEMAEAIFGLKRVAASEIDTNEKALHRDERVEKSKLFLWRQRLEEARFLDKLLMSIIKVFKLAEIKAKRDRSEENCESVYDAIEQCWEPSVLPGV